MFPSDQKLAEAFRDLESKICNVKNMSSIASRMVEDMIDGAKHIDGLRTLRLTEEQVEVLMFAVFHAEHMADNLKSGWYAVAEG